MENEEVEEVKANVKDRIIPSAIGDIHTPNGSSKIPFDMDFAFNPGIPITLSSDEGYGASTIEKGAQQEKPSGLKVAAAEFYQFNATLPAAHAGVDWLKQPDPLLDIPEAGWKPTSQPEMFYDVNTQYLPYLMDARGPKDLQYRRDRVISEQEHDETLANGSMFFRILGGAAGAIIDPVNLLPIGIGVKYARLSTTILKTMQKTLPGMAAVGTIQSASKQLDKVNGNLHDFVLDAFINTIFGTALFGAFKGVSLAGEKMELWNLRDLAKSSIKGVDFKFDLGKKGEINGIKAFDTTGNLSAAEVSYAQELANTSFHKSGLFKIPYVGQGLLTLKGAPVIGSPAIRMMNSTYETTRAFIARANDTSSVTKGVAAGTDVTPKSFKLRMDQEFAELRGIAAQMNTLHLERMGFDIKPRIAQDITQLGLGLYNSALKLIQKDVEKYGHITRDAFDDEVQQVLSSGEASQHAAVNDAAALIRPKLDGAYKAWREAHGLSENFMPPKFAKAFMMRVYDTQYMQTNKYGVNGWVPIMSKYFKESDVLIRERMEPITLLKQQLQSEIEAHTALIRNPKVTDKEIKISSNSLQKLKIDLNAEENKLQNELRSNETWHYHVDNWFDLSADEAKQLLQITKKRDTLQKQIDEQQKVVIELKNQASKSKQSSIKGKTKETAQKHAAEQEMAKHLTVAEETKLGDLKAQLQDEEYELYSKARNGEIDSNLYYPETHKLKNPNDRLKFRNTFEHDEAINTYVKAAYDTIMHTNPEDTIADVMGKFLGSSKENHLKARSFAVPDEILYNNNFMTKNLMSKVNNYVLYLSRRTHLKNTFKDVTHDGGIEPLLAGLNKEYQAKRAPFDEKKARIGEQLSKIDKEKNADRFNKLTKIAKSVDKKINAETRRFNADKSDIGESYERMMGLKKRERWEIVTQGIVRSLAAMVNLHFVGATQIADLGAIGLQAGVWPFVRDSVYPVITSLNGLIKTKDSEAVREMLPHLHLGFNDVLNGHADQNIAMESQPYLNMGRIVEGAAKLAHYSGNADLTSYIQNNLQRWAGAAWQSKFMKILTKHSEGKANPKDLENIRKYGIDPDKWSGRMTAAFKESGGFKTKLGGYQSRFWKWQDMEASNEFSTAVFKAIQNTIISRGMFDSPWWADNLLGMVFHTFTGWGFASINRYVIPTLQRPDAEKMIGVMFALAMGSLVSPTRRMIRGEDAYPEDMTPEQHLYEAASDSAVGSALANTLSYANFLSGDRLIGDLKNDKFRNRVGIGASSAVFGTANRMVNILDAMASGEWNQKDAKQAAKMMMFTGSMYGYDISKTLIEKSGLPVNRAAAHAEKE